MPPKTRIRRLNAGTHAFSTFLKPEPRKAVIDSVHVEATTLLASEAIVGALVMSLVGTNGHMLLVYGKSGYMGSLGRLVDLHALSGTFHALHGAVHLLSHHHGE